MRTIKNVTAWNEAYKEEMRRDKDIVIIGEDIAKNGGIMAQTLGLLDEFGPERVIDAPIAENAQASFAMGLAAQGKKVIIDFMNADFMAYCMDGIVNQAAKQRYLSSGKWTFPIVFLTLQGAGGFLAGGQHESTVESWFTGTPGLKIYVPTFPADGKGLLKYAIREPDPVIFFAPRMFAMDGEVPDLDVDYIVEPGKANVIKEGKDVSIIGYGLGILNAMKAQKDLADKGIDAEIIDLRTLVPLDKAAIFKSIKKTGKLILSTEAPERGAYGNYILSLILQECPEALTKKPKFITSKNYPLPFGPSQKYVLPQPEDIVAAALELCDK